MQPAASIEATKPLVTAGSHYQMAGYSQGNLAASASSSFDTSQSTSTESEHMRRVQAFQLPGSQPSQFCSPAGAVSYTPLQQAPSFIIPQQPPTPANHNGGAPASAAPTPSGAVALSRTTSSVAAGAASQLSKRNASPVPPSALLLKAVDIHEVQFIATCFCFTVPKAMRKQLTRQYRACEQIVVFVAVDDIIAARGVIASDVIPRSQAKKTIPHIEAEIPAHWQNVFRITNFAVLNERALRLGLPCPLSDRSELPSHVDAGFAISRVWSSTIMTFVEATVALASGKAEHYTLHLELIEHSDPNGNVPTEIRDMVSAVKMVSHGPGVVVLGYIARYFGRPGREFIANCLFELNAGVIDLCRNSIGGALISFLVRHGTCATPRILQLVPWRVVATRILCDQVGSQTASLMLHSALQFHRTTRHALEPIAVSSLTHRVLTKNFADATDPSNECSISNIASNAQSCRVLQLVVEASVELLAMHAAGALPTANEEIVYSAQKVVTALCDLADKHAANSWSNYATQSLISACTLRCEETPEAAAKGRYFDALLARVLVVVRPQIVQLSCHKCGGNVIEKLCAARPNITTQVAAALLESPGAYPKLASDRYGNYVIQTLLQHLPMTLELRVRDALLPVLGTLDRHWHCTVAIETWCRGVDERQRRHQQQTLMMVPPHGSSHQMQQLY